ncbi:MAG: SgcJ/EcaC family oxidoreductase [Pseudomonadota bacterium]
MHTVLAVAFAGLLLQAMPAAQAQTLQTSIFHPHARGHYEARQRAEIEEVLNRYAAGLNAADLSAVAELYTEDGVLMAPEAAPAVGIDAVRASYAGTFEAIGLKLSFEIAELKLLAHDWALLRTNSTGVITILANGAQIPEGNQELFLMHKRQGQWKIARYSFSSSLAPARP